MLRPNQRPRMIKLKSPRELGLMREAGKLVSRALDAVRPLPANGAKAQGVRRCQARDGKRAAEEKGRTEKTNPNELT